MYGQNAVEELNVIIVYVEISKTDSVESCKVYWDVWEKNIELGMT